MTRKHRKEYDKQRSLLLIKQKRLFIVQYLLSHSCIDCGETDILCLDFDHIKNKKNTISDIIPRRYTLSYLKKEIEKCVIRCSNCHRRKTAKDFGSYKLDALNKLKRNKKTK